MSIPKSVKQYDFFGELTVDEQREYFSMSAKKFLPSIDNIYFSIPIKDDYNDNAQLVPLFARLSELKQLVAQTHQPVAFFGCLTLEARGFQIYRYCLTMPDMYDVFLLDYLPNQNTPRIIVQLRAYGLWLYGWEYIVSSCYNQIQALFSEYGCELLEVKENRIDYCYHTNTIQNPERLFSDRNLIRTMKTTMERYHVTGRIETRDSETVLFKEYFALGERKSNNVFIRFYDKALEVIEQGYKAFFFEIWHSNGLISFYDKFCLEYAYKHKNYSLIHKARLEFYLTYGKSETVKREFELTLKDTNLTIADIKKLADAYMPEVTKVLNIEFETKRKFYYYSDDFINLLPIKKRETALPSALKRLYRIIDNRLLFLDYLTDKTLRFVKPDGSFCDFWKRLRSVKMDSFKHDEKLVRDYSNTLDKELMKQRLIGVVASNAAYIDKGVESGFVEDLSDVLSNINDNDKVKCTLSVVREFVQEDANGINVVIRNDAPYLTGGSLQYYHAKKAQRLSRIKNRKPKPDDSGVKHTHENQTGNL